jgi:hypothetical protein
MTVINMSGSARLSDYTLDIFIAPKLSKLTECSASDLSDLTDQWLDNFILNNIFKFDSPDTDKAYLLNFLRRVEAVFYEYNKARNALTEYITTDRNRISPIFHALNHFETLFAQLHQAYESYEKRNYYLFSWNNVPGKDIERLKTFLMEDFNIGWAENAEILKNNDDKIICISMDKYSAEIIIDKQKKEATLKISDGRTSVFDVKNEYYKQNIYKKKRFEASFQSKLDRVRKIYNASKHMDQRIRNGELPEKGTCAIWITNNGIECNNAAITFVELKDILIGLSKLANKISNLTP